MILKPFVTDLRAQQLILVLLLTDFKFFKRLVTYGTSPIHLMLEYSNTK